MKIRTLFIAALLLSISWLCTACMIVMKQVTYFSPSGPGKILGRHEDSWAGPNDLIQYKLAENTTVEVYFGPNHIKEYPQKYLLTVGFRIPKGYALKKNLSSKYEIKSPGLDECLIVKANFIWGMDSKGGIDCDLYEDLNGGDDVYYEIVILLDLPELNTVTISFPEYNLNGHKLIIPQTFFFKKEGSFFYPLTF